MSTTEIRYSVFSTGPLPTTNINIVTLLQDLNANLINDLDEDFIFEFNIYLETELVEGDLVYIFKPFRNMLNSSKEIVDFSTKDLNFSLNSPVDIEIQASYDGTVNLILTDNLNPPRMVNSRFSATEGKRYYVVDRFGSNDTNLYDYDKMDRQTRLYKTINKIPRLSFVGLKQDGKLAVGNYVFYFRLVDADDNETDIITESGIVSCHVGGINDPLSIRGGIGNENSSKSVIFNFQDLDTNYAFLNVYYSRSTSDYSKQEITTYYKISTKYSIKSESFDFRITGYEPTERITRDQINLQYNIIDRNATAAQTQNRLFLANIHKTSLPYLELRDLSCRILPTPSQINGLNIGFLNTDYTSIKEGECAYYNSNHVYNYTGYWDDEIYRFAVVYIMKDFSLSDPYNLRGGDFSTPGLYSYSTSVDHPLYENGTRKYITSDINGFLNVKITDFLENIKGVVKVKGPNAQITTGTVQPIGIKIEIPEEVQNELIKYTRGFFIVRQKRIPTILGQGFSIGHDTISGLPLIPEFVNGVQAHTIQGTTIYKEGYAGVTTPEYDSVDKALTAAATKYRLPAKGEVYFNFISDKNIANGTTLALRVDKGGSMIVPDLVLNSEYLAQVLSGSEFTITSARFAPIYPGFTRYTKNLYSSGRTLDQIDQIATNFVIDDYKTNDNTRKDTVTLISVQEDTTLVSFANSYFSSRAGIPEEPWRFSAFLKEEYGLVDAVYTSGVPFPYNGVGYSHNQNALIRGHFMPYVGVVNKSSSTPLESGLFYNIRTLGYSSSNTRDLFIVRSNDSAPFMSITDRFSWGSFNLNPSDNGVRSIHAFRGDCFINQATIRVLRNFQDPELPSNDVIVNYTTLDGFKGYKDISGTSGILTLQEAETTNETAGTGIYAIIRADVNATKLGYWVTFKFCSDINFAFRCTDPTYLAEQSIFGKPRGFYPLYDRSLAGNSKIPESTVINAGYNSTTSDKEHFVIPDVQSIKNDFTNRIMFSEIHATDAFKNGYRIFEGLNYRDYTIEFGTITKIIAWGSNLVVVFENGVGMVPINERTMAGVAEGENIFTRGAGVLAEKPFMLSQGIGSSWKDSITTSQNYIYGVDTTAKKIWRTEGTKFEVFSDFKVQKFLNDNLDLTVYDRTPAIGLKNVVTHFNLHKYDIMFTFYDQTFNEEEKVWNLCFNEQLNNWVTRYSWSPAFSENLNNTLFTFSRGTCKVTSMISKSINSADGIGNIYIDTPTEVTLSVNDYLSLLYESKVEDSLSVYASQTYNLDQYSTVINVLNGYPIEFLDSATTGIHPMAVAGNYPDGYDKTAVITPEAGNILLVYNMFNAKYLLSSNSTLSFYRSSNTSLNLTGDELIVVKVNDDFINNSVQTTVSKPNLKIVFHVDGTANEKEALSLVRDGWSFNITALSSNAILLDTTEYLLTLQGVDKYKNPTLEFSTVITDNPIYDNNIFAIDKSSSILSIRANAFAYDYIDVKYSKFLEVLKRIYFSLLIDLRVYLRKGEYNAVAGAYDQFRDAIYVRPSLQVIRDLQALFDDPLTAPPLRPGISFTAEQCLEIVKILTATESKYIANTTTDLWKHGNTDIFGTDTTTAPAVWYDEVHPFEFEFVVNGDELGIHKLFDNLKIISNKAEPESFEFEIIGDSYEFTRENLKQNPNEPEETYLKTGYSLIAPTVEVTNNKTRERGIRIVQPSKNVKNVGLRKGNIHYKEDMWEVVISPIRVLYNNKTIESKIRDKYCKVRVKYAGNQLAIITALQTIYTLSNS